MTLRARLVVVLAALVAAGFVLSGIATYGALRSFLYDRVEDQLRQTQPIAIRVLIESAGGGDVTSGEAPGLPVSAYAEARDAAGNVVASRSFGFSRESRVYV
ncbi:MAG TPA: hypothetical protein VHJ76_00065, partial [Actinomycetota bacterium]|nr:hypothetical protein [Actinomycetota bacterium]